MAGRLKVTQVKSAIGYERDQGVTLKALGLGKMWRTVEKDDTPAIRGMLNKVRHLIRIEPAGAAPVPAARPPEFRVISAPPAETAGAQIPATGPSGAEPDTQVQTKETGSATGSRKAQTAAAESVTVDTPEYADPGSTPKPDAPPGDAEATPASEEGESSS